MTAPAFVRHWNDPRPPRPDRRVPGGAEAGGRRVAEGSDGRGRAVSVEGLGPGGRAGRLVATCARAFAGEGLTARVTASVAGVRRVAPMGAVLLTGLVVHAAVAAHLAVRGAAADVLLVSVVAVAAAGGSRAGAGYGFAAGLGADLFLTTPLGTAALAYTVLGHAVGRMGRPGPTGQSAAALCRPDSACFACRTVGRHGWGPASGPEPAEERSALRATGAPPVRRDGESGSAPARRPTRAQRRAAARRTAFRRSVLLTFMGVGAGRVGTAAVATALAGVPFPGMPGLLRMTGVAAVSSLLGPPAFALLRRRRPSGGGAR